MLRRLVLVLSLLQLLTIPLTAQRSLFSETIPMQGHIELQESFSLNVRERIQFTLSQEMAGTTHEVATYEFFSNSPDVAYQLRLSPGFATQLGANVFAFRSVGLGADNNSPPIPFKLSLVNRANLDRISNEDFDAIQKSIGIREGSRSTEQGIIYVTFPTVEEGFDLQGYTFGAYEASIAVEVSAD
ncbi:hypothetical protein [Pleomorphochaeta sp. DL1XJH-081]|uniref:hypothetical protein n=1 Tax=Pleomorphochaeta sp. DL1XJH-081 TaxID=3409690 RepID=UPI003BB743CA